MSDEENNPLDLTGLDFGPAWAKEKAPARDYSKEVGPREGRDRRGSGPRREGGGSGDRRNDRRQSNDRRNQRSDQKGDRRQPDRRGGDRRNQQREPRMEVPAPEGYIGGVMPVEEGLDNLAKEIQGGGRTYSVFDLARVVMGARERFNVTFEAPKGSKFFRCKSDGSVWLSKEEAVSHFWDADLLPELYEEIESEVDPPKGNFTAVAKCGLSGEWLAPPNYHSYQASIAQLHAERFAHMSLEDYKRKIRVENGEEIVAAWLQSQTKQTRFRPLSTAEILELREKRKAAETTQPAEKKEEQSEEPKQEIPAEEVAETPAEEVPAIEPVEEVKAEISTEPLAEAADETASPEEAEVAEETATEELAEASSDEQAKEPKVEIELLETRRDVERHFADHHFKHIYAEVDRAWVPGNVSAKLLSSALLTLLKATVADERRYPSKLTPILCRQLSGRHLAVFKWRKKLKAGPARPHAVPNDLNLAERPQKMLSWVEENSGKNLEDFWKVFLPEDADSDTKRTYYHDLHWLLNQGFVLLMADSTIHLAKSKPKPVEPKEEKPKAEEAKADLPEEAPPKSEEAPLAEAAAEPQEETREKSQPAEAEAATSEQDDSPKDDSLEETSPSA